MTTGIYRLSFTGTTKVYIGMSRNIESRYAKHLSYLRTDTASEKMMSAYRLYGIPKLDILCECSEIELEKYENEAIDIFDSVNNGFNTVKYSNGRMTTKHGEDQHNALYSNEIYHKILIALARSNDTVLDISEALEVSTNVVSQIKQCINHKWLNDRYPDLYNIIRSKLDSYKTNGRSLEYVGREVFIISPIGKKIKVSCIISFCRENNLDPGAISKLINGKIQFSKGWHLESTSKPPTIVLKDPEGLLHTVTGSILQFAKKHSLDNSRLSKMIRGEISMYRGWSVNNV